MIKKVVIVHTDFRLYWPSRLRQLNSYFVLKGVDFSVVEIAGKGSPYNFAEGKAAEKDLCWTQLFGSRRMEEIPACEAVDAVIRKLDELDPDAVIAGAVAFPSGAAAARWCSRKKRSVILFDDARLDDVPRPLYVDWIKKQVYSLVDAMVIPAPSHDPTYRYFGFAKERLFYGVNAIDNMFFSPNLAEGSGHLPASFAQQSLLLGVGRQIPKKNWKTLLRAFSIVAENPIARQWSLVLIGDGPEHDELVDMAGDLLDRRICFVPFRQQSELVSYYHQAAALVLPSLFGETWGLVVNEAMAAGLPVLVSEKCGCAETLVRDGVNGYVFNPDSLDETEAVLLKFFSLDSASRTRQGEASLGIIADWGLERFCRGMWDALNTVQDREKRRGSLAGRFIIRFWNGRYCPT
jgi:glycosyltransferase involved in cell wall biosynthesis